MNISTCGIDCDSCKYFNDQKCAGCRIVAPEGKCVWGGRCELHDCVNGKSLPHCGKCEEFPCEKLVDAHKGENPEGKGNGIEIENLRALI